MKKRLFLLPLMTIGLLGCQAPTTKEYTWISLNNDNLLVIYIYETVTVFEEKENEYIDIKFYVEQDGNITTIGINYKRNNFESVVTDNTTINITYQTEETEIISGANVSYILYKRTIINNQGN